MVNIVDRRIPRREPKNAIGVAGLLSYGTAADERSANLSVDVPLGSNCVVHADGNWSKSDELETGGHLLTRELREQAAASPFPEIQELADLKDELPNTAAKSWEVAGGLDYVDGDLNVGVSVTHHDSSRAGHQVVGAVRILRKRGGLRDGVQAARVTGQGLGKGLSR